MPQYFWQWWNWLWTADGAAWAGVGAASVAVFFAILSWRTSVNATRSTFRPVLRPEPLAAAGGFDKKRLILENIGNGPAISVYVSNVGKTPAAVGAIDLIPQPSLTRDNLTPHRVSLEVDGELSDYGHYEVIYRDLDGIWHQTTFYGNRDKFHVLFQGPQNWWRDRKKWSRLRRTHTVRPR